jgi:GR25 family glycosyltransferase involved in LPS biosynthesis
MNAWIDFFDEIYVLNLAKRTDRLLQITEDFEKYNIPFTRIDAIEDREQGARGLRDSVRNIFNSSLEKNHEHILLFEDDAKIIEDLFWFHDTMNKVVTQLPQDYIMCFLGGQASHRFSHFHSPNLLPVTNYFATHSVAYSNKGMKEILATLNFHTDQGYPIDNFYVREVQNRGGCYTAHPLLCSQYPGHSDIGHNFIDWSPFIIPRHAQKIAEMGR